MRILGLDTTGAQCSVALVDAAKVLAYKSEKIGRGHAERLAPMVAEVLSDAQIDISEIDQIAVCTGPGSFTGLRVALAFAKGLALPRSIPVIGISALEVHAARHDAAQEKRHRQQGREDGEKDDELHRRGEQLAAYKPCRTETRHHEMCGQTRDGLTPSPISAASSASIIAVAPQTSWPASSK